MTIGVFLVWFLVLTLVFGVVALLVSKAPFLDAEIKSFGRFALLAVYVVAIVVLALEAFGLLGAGHDILNRPLR